MKHSPQQAFFFFFLNAPRIVQEKITLYTELSNYTRKIVVGLYTMLFA
jgi:hypothetical protein